jgi:hypothetical protein
VTETKLTQPFETQMLNGRRKYIRNCVSRKAELQQQKVYSGCIAGINTISINP